MLPISTIHYPYHTVVINTLLVVEIGWDGVYLDSRLVVCTLQVVGVGWDEVSFEGRQKIEEK